MVDKAKYRAIPTLAMARVNQPKVGTKEWIEKIANAHGSTSASRLEHRRRGLSAYIGLIENTMKQMQAWKKEFEIDAEAREKEVLANLKKVDATLAKIKDDDAQGKSAAMAERQKLEEIQRRLVYEYRAQMLNFKVHISQVQYQLASIESWCQIIDNLSIRVNVKGKNTKKKGTIRYSVASFAFDTSSLLCDIYELLLNLQPQPAEGEESGPGAAEPEADDEEVVTDEEADEYEAAKRKKLEGGA